MSQVLAVRTWKLTFKTGSYTLTFIRILVASCPNLVCPLICFQVRGLESTIDGLQQTLVGQGVDSGNVENAGMRLEITKLQQELDELCVGTPAQITEKMVPYMNPSTHLAFCW